MRVLGALELCSVVLGLCLLGCDAGEITIFSANDTGGTAGVGGMGGNAGASAASGSFLGGAGGGAGSDGQGAGGVAGNPWALGGSGGDITSERPCLSNADCDVNYFCSKQRCGDVQGLCMLTAFPDPTQDLQVCGCDGITYWNDSYRQRFGIAASTLGPCQSGAALCIRDQDCGALHGYSCEHLLAPTATCGSPPSPGRCWVTPRDCVVTPADDKQYQICPPPSGGAGAPPPCVTKCEAVQSGHPFTELATDQVCP